MLASQGKDVKPWGGKMLHKRWAILLPRVLSDLPEKKATEIPMRQVSLSET